LGETTNSTAAWEVPLVEGKHGEYLSFNKFRLLQQGMTSRNGGHRICCNGIELYGQLTAKTKSPCSHPL
jgi:hypothetical protein